MLRRALAGITIFGAVPRTPGLVQPSRHLGLVQAQERPDLNAYLDAAGDLVKRTVDIHALLALNNSRLVTAPSARITPPAQNIAIARDAAFAFSYPHLLDDWRAAGANVTVFSPLADDPAPQADFIYLPGGYPELHAGKLAANQRFHDSLRDTAAQIYGECGGYMVLGDGLVDAQGQSHKMAGLLRLETSFATRKLHLGYRSLKATQGPLRGAWTGHEFHYATTVKSVGTPLFQAKDAEGNPLPDMGLIAGNVSGSFAHLIDAT
jgi:cobyrinic acid a,c-diamide synthase